MNLFANASVTIEFSPLLIAGFVGLLLGVFTLYKAVRLVMRQPRYGSLFLVSLIIAGIFGRAILQDLGKLDQLLEQITPPGVYLLGALTIAAGLWSFSMLIYGTDFYTEKTRAARKWGVFFTLLTLVAVVALGACNTYMDSMPSTRGLCQFASTLLLVLFSIATIGYVMSEK